MTKKTSPAYRASKEETIPINKLHPFSNHPFHIRHDLEFSELVDSISESGIITPIIVRPKVGVGYEVISGHRRWEACKELGIESIPARVEYIVYWVISVAIFLARLYFYGHNPAVVSRV